MTSSLDKGETPRSDEAGRRYGPISGGVWNLCRQLERELAEANKYVATLEKVICGQGTESIVSAERHGEPIGEVVGHNAPGNPVVRWLDGGLRPIGMKLYKAPTALASASAVAAVEPVAWLVHHRSGSCVATRLKADAEHFAQFPEYTVEPLFTRSASAPSAEQSALAALSELVRLKNIKDALDDHAAGVKMLGEEWFGMNEDYRTNKPPAWQRAREAVAGRVASATAYEERPGYVLQRCSCGFPKWPCNRTQTDCLMYRPASTR